MVFSKMIFQSFSIFLFFVRGETQKVRPKESHLARRRRQCARPSSCSSFQRHMRSVRPQSAAYKCRIHSPTIFFLSSLRRSISRCPARAPRAHHGVERVLPGQPLFSVDARKLRRSRHQAYLGPAAIRLHFMHPHRLLREQGRTQRRYAAIPAPPPV
jgi:hypothetical protein